MPAFRYEAVNASGLASKGVVHADREGLDDRMRPFFEGQWLRSRR